ncbi:MAG: DUF4339 domain-containing protein [Treponema sp.]|jgi:hypothetical protein|nr:DUF4339 domain-containing protein [Treponema sp.]
MGFLDSFLKITGAVLTEIFKDRPQDIAEWLDSMKASGAVEANLRRKGRKGIYLVTGAAFDAKGKCIDHKTWQIEGNTGFKKIMEGDQSGLGEIFDWKNEITYDLIAEDELLNSDKQYLISKDYKQTGPFSIGQIKMMIANGIISYDYYACLLGESDWVPIKDILNDDDDDEDYEEEEDDDDDFEEEEDDEDDFDAEEDDDDFDEEDDDDDEDYDDDE